MKKKLSIFSAILLTSAIGTSTTACAKQPFTKYNLKDDLTNLNLGLINEKTPGTLPTPNEILESLHNKNLSLDISKIILSNEQVNKVDVTGDGIFYTKDTITVTFQETTLNINNLIVEGTYLGKIATTSTVSNEQVKTAIKEQIHMIDVSHIIVDVIDNKTASVTGDNVVYNGMVNVSFTTDNSVALSSIIDSTKPLVMVIPGQNVPTAAQVISKLHDMYQNLDTNFININNITEVNATVNSTDETKYTGSLILTLQIDKSINLSSVINKGLSKVAITGKNITINDVIKALQKQYSTLNVNAINVKLSQDNKTVTISSTNPKIYTGAEVIINNLKIDLNSVLSLKLPEFIIPGESAPTTAQVKDALAKTNLNLEIDHVAITNITKTSVVITGDDKLYSNDVMTINYTCNTAIPLSSDFTNLDLGVINTNGMSYPTVEQVTSAISKANPNLNINAIRFTDSSISDHQVIVTGDGLSYQGTVTANFTVDSSTISVNGFNYNHTETNSVFSLKVNWIGIDQVVLDNWTNYAPDWNSFIAKFSKLSFGNDASFGIFCNNYCDNKLTGSQLDVDTTKITEDRNTIMFQEDYSYNGGFAGAVIELHGQLHIWHNATTIYVNYTGNADTLKCMRDRVLNVNLPSATFSK